MQFAVSTAGIQNIVVSWSQQSSKTGGKYFRLQYSTNSGASFVDFPVAVVLPLATNVFTAFTNDLSAMPGVSNNPNFVFRIVAEFQSTATGSGSAAYVAANAGSTYASSGTTRFDMVTVSGTSYIVATPAALTSVAFTNGQFVFTVSGSVGASYVVQTSTNLAATQLDSAVHERFAVHFHRHQHHRVAAKILSGRHIALIDGWGQCPREPAKITSPPG